MTRISERKPIDGETEPVKCHYCKKWATNRGLIKGIPLCEEHTEIFYEGFWAGEIANTMSYLDAYPELREKSPFKDNPEMVHEIAVVTRMLEKQRKG